MMVIGITGGIASGKSTLARQFARYHIPHIDADKLVHTLFDHDRHTIQALAKYFPGTVVNDRVDRRKLAEIIGDSPARLQQLEAIVHPRVRLVEERAIRAARRQRRRAIILDIPLLFETDAQDLCDVVIAVRAPVPMRKQRALRRARPMREETFARLLARQLPDSVRCARADYVVAGNIGKAHMRKYVARWLKEWRVL